MHMDRPSKAQANITLKHCPIVPEPPEEIKCENKDRKMLEIAVFPDPWYLLFYANIREDGQTLCIGLGTKGSRVLAHLFFGTNMDMKQILTCLSCFVCSTTHVAFEFQEKHLFSPGKVAKEQLSVGDCIGIANDDQNLQLLPG